VHDLARPRHFLDPDELDPLDMANDSEVHISHLLAGVRFTGG
jgi:hypothetical protein